MKVEVNRGLFELSHGSGIGLGFRGFEVKVWG